MIDLVTFSVLAGYAFWFFLVFTKSQEKRPKAFFILVWIFFGGLFGSEAGLASQGSAQNAIFIIAAFFAVTGTIVWPYFEKWWSSAQNSTHSESLTKKDADEEG